MKIFHLLFAMMTLTLISVAAHAKAPESAQDEAACAAAFKLLASEANVGMSLSRTGCDIMSTSKGELANTSASEAVNTYYLLAVEGSVSIGERKGQLVYRAYRTSILNDGSSGLVRGEGAISKFHTSPWINH